MSRKEYRITQTITWEDLFKIVLSWFIIKIMDMIWGKIKPRIRFEGKINIGDWILAFTGFHLIVPTFFATVDFAILDKYATKAGYEDTERTLLKDVLFAHANYHKVIIGKKNCRYCPKINRYKLLFQKYISDPELYPPFHQAH
jgi:hypothetical protein